MKQYSQLSLIVQPEEFFHELVTDALGNRNLRPQPETEFYLVQLLSRFMKADHLYRRDGEGHAREEPLALMVKEALEQPEPGAQSTMLRQVGDVSLYTAGYFQDSLSRKLVDVDYYIDMGGAAYQQVAARVEERVLRLLYEELADKFAAFVDVLAEVSDKTSSKSEKDLLRQYELYVRTRSERAAKALQQAGILPNPQVKKNLQ
jgi:hypothetical protein